MTWREKKLTEAEEPEVNLNFSPWRGISGEIIFTREVKSKGKTNFDQWTIQFPQLSLTGLKCIAESLDNILGEIEAYTDSIRKTVNPD